MFSVGSQVAHAQGARTTIRNSTRTVQRAIQNQIRQGLRVRLEVRDPPRSPLGAFKLMADGRTAVATFGDGTVDVWRIDQGAAHQAVAVGPSPLSFVEVVDDGAMVAAVDGQGRLRLAPLDSGRSGPPAPAIGGVATALGVAGSRGTVIVGTDRGTVLEVGGGGAVARLWGSAGPAVQGLTVDRAGNRILVQSANGELVLLDRSPAGTFVEVRRWRVNGVRASHLTQSGGVALLDDGSLVELRPDGTVRPHQSPVRGVVLSGAPGGAFAVLAADGQGAVWPRGFEFESVRFSVDMAGFVKADLVEGGGNLLVRRASGWVDGYDTGPGDRGRVLRLVGTRSGWAAIDESGRYDGVQAALREAGWGSDGAFLELERFADQYYEPGLVRRYLAQRNDFITAPAQAVTDEAEVPAPPTVELSAQRVERGGQAFAVVAGSVSAGGPIQDARLFHNGRALPSDGVRVGAAQSGNAGDLQISADVPLTAGPNVFQLVVLTGAGYRTASSQVSLQGAVPDPKTPPGGLFITSVGIDRYAGEDLRLNYAVADATAIADRFYQMPLFSPEAREKRVFLDKDAQRAAILRQLKELESRKPDDMLVVFLSGHGVVQDDKWYFLPQESKNITSAGRLREFGIDSTTVVETLARVKSERVVLVIDTCQSGEVADEFDRYVKIRNLSQVADSTGVQILTSTRSDQLAPEYDQLGHGLFTYVLLFALQEGVDGSLNADRDPPDGRVTVSELRGYTLEYVPLLAAELNRQIAARESVGAERQRGLLTSNTITPVASSYGADFRIF